MTETKQTLFAALRADHEKQRTLADLLCKTHGDSEGRQQLFERLKRAVKEHAAAEERNLYAPMMEHDLSQAKARHSVAEHKELDDMLEVLGTTDMSSSSWLAHAKAFHERLLHHLDEEEHEFFQIAGKVLSEKEKIALADGYLDMAG